jgi:oligoribonuclease NrnB/cAMP/cGMP phosphodiesterase (DHH superfamily)
MSKKIIQIVAHNDFDGGASAVCIVNYIKQRYGKDYPYQMWFGGYDKVNMYVERLLDWPDKFQEVIIADISTSVELAKEFPDHFTTIDHHDSAAKLKGLSKNCFIDTSGNHCGASMCYKLLLKDKGYEYKHLTKLSAIALDYDLWHLKLPNNIAKNLNYIYYMYWGEKFVQRFENGFDGFNKIEKDFLKAKHDDIQKQINEVEIIDLLQDEKGMKGKFATFIIKNGQTEINDICDDLLMKRNYDVVIAVNAIKQKISVRCSENAHVKGLHVGMTHESLGVGGGHPKAGGAQYTNDEQLQQIYETYASKVIELAI